MTLTNIQRDALTLIGLMDHPSVAAELVDCWTPGRIRDVALTLAAAFDVDASPSQLWPDVPVTKGRRLHGPKAGPHRCDRPECGDLNRRWEADYRRARRAAAKQAA